MNRLTKKEGTDVSSLISTPKVRLQDYMRATDDIDIALKFPNDGESDIETARKINELFEVTPNAASYNIRHLRNNNECESDNEYHVVICCGCAIERL